jgi:hypothetical protein
MAHLRRLVSFGLGLVFALAASAVVRGQQGEPPSTVSAVWLRGFAATGQELFLAQGENTPVPLAVGGSSRGKPIELRGASAPLRLLRRAANAPASGDKSAGFVPVTEVRLPAGNPKRVLLVLASAGGGGAIRATAMADDEASFPAHTVRVANFAGAPVLMRLDRQVKPVAPGATEPMPYAVLADPKLRDVPSFPFALAAQDDVFFNGRIDAWPNSRTLVLVAPPAAEGRPPGVQVLIDRPKPPAPPKVAAK